MILLAAVITVSVSMASVGGSKTEETKEGTIIKATADCSVQDGIYALRKLHSMRSADPVRLNFPGFAFEKLALLARSD